MALSTLTAISPIDGRYHAITSHLHHFFSEKGLIRYRLYVEIKYLIALVPFLQAAQYKPLVNLKLDLAILENIHSLSDFSLEEANRVKEFELQTNHDLKAVEYYLKYKISELAKTTNDSSWHAIIEMVHFGLTSQDINNLAIPLAFKDSLETYRCILDEVVCPLEAMAKEWINIPMLARTHGQPATPTSIGKELYVWVYRIRNQLSLLSQVPSSGKFGGATGQFNAHYIAFSHLDWIQFGNTFVESLGLVRETWTTQISNYDNLAALFDNLKRINVILIDLCRDFWHYISIEYFGQKIISTEVGSSAMPHKVNPIDFENAEGNLCVANALFEFLAQKLPNSRLQRDLTDSTVLRNIGVPMSHTIIALNSLKKGLKKIFINKERLIMDLEQNFIVISEAVQTILRREGYPKPYEAVKELTRACQQLEKGQFCEFVDSLNISEQVKTEIKALSPLNYSGVFPPMV